MGEYILDFQLYGVPKHIRHVKVIRRYGRGVMRQEGEVLFSSDLEATTSEMGQPILSKELTAIDLREDVWEIQCIAGESADPTQQEPGDLTQILPIGPLKSLFSLEEVDFLGHDAHRPTDAESKFKPGLKKWHCSYVMNDSFVVLENKVIDKSEEYAMEYAKNPSTVPTSASRAVVQTTHPDLAKKPHNPGIEGGVTKHQPLAWQGWIPMYTPSTSSALREKVESPGWFANEDGLVSHLTGCVNYMREAPKIDLRINLKQIPLLHIYYMRVMGAQKRVSIESTLPHKGLIDKTGYFSEKDAASKMAIAASRAGGSARPAAGTAASKTSIPILASEERRQDLNIERGQHLFANLVEHHRVPMNDLCATQDEEDTVDRNNVAQENDPRFMTMNVAKSEFASDLKSSCSMHLGRTPPACSTKHPTSAAISRGTGSFWGGPGGVGLFGPGG